MPKECRWCFDIAVEPRVELITSYAAEQTFDDYTRNDGAVHSKFNRSLKRAGKSGRKKKVDLHGKSRYN